MVREGSVVSTEKLLVVDDDQAFLDLMVHHLKRKGYDPEGALDGKGALHVINSKGPISVLVTDLMMPGMSGLELLRLAKKIDPSMEVIVITAAPSLEMAISAMREDGAFDYLTKPLDMIGELSLAVERALEHRRMKIEKDELRERLLENAEKLRLVLETTSASILAVDEHEKVIIASSDITGHLDFPDEEVELDASQMPEALLELVSQWQDLGCPVSAKVELYWPDNELRLVDIAPIPSGESINGGWVMILNNISSQNRVEAYVLDKIISLGHRIRSPMVAAISLLRELDHLVNQNGAEGKDKMAAIQGCLDRVLQDSADLKEFDTDIQIVENTRIPLTDFISREEERQVNEYGITNQFRFKWDLKSDLPQVKIDLQLMYQILQHLSFWASNIGKRSDTVLVSCWNQSNRIWFRIQGAGLVNLEGEEFSIGDDPLELVGRLERSEIHMAFAKSLINTLRGRLWTWLDESGGANVAFFVPGA